jgi:hypothetical protein
MEQFLQQHWWFIWILWDQLDRLFFLANQTTWLARLLNSNLNCLLWAGIRPAPWLLNQFSLFCWTPSYSSVIFLTVLLTCLSLFSCSLTVLWALWPGLQCPHMDCKESTNCPCWNAIWWLITIATSFVSFTAETSFPSSLGMTIL